MNRALTTPALRSSLHDSTDRAPRRTCPHQGRGSGDEDRGRDPPRGVRAAQAHERRVLRRFAPRLDSFQP
eukprot:28401-Pelagococcus_subviridis.AAC.8